MTTVEEMMRLNTQFAELMKRVGAGHLHAGTVRRVLQELIQKQHTPPSWWVEPEQQMSKLRELFGASIKLPMPPVDFVPETWSEVLLLHVPMKVSAFARALNRVYGNIVIDESILQPGNLRMQSAPPYEGQPVWVAFDPEAHRGKSFTAIHDEPRLASFEVFSALLQFPDWVAQWGTHANAAARPSLPNLRVKLPVEPCWQEDSEWEWRYAPCVTKSSSEVRVALTDTDNPSGRDGRGTPSEAHPTIRLIG